MKYNFRNGTLLLALTFYLLISCKKEDPFINTPPVIENQQFSINENSNNGTTIGTVVASDIDKNQILKYYIISGNFDNAFKIDSTTGVVSVNNVLALDYEKVTFYALGINVKDDYSNSLTSTAVLIIKINDIVNVHGILANYQFNGNANDLAEGAQHGIVHGAVLTTGRNNDADGAYLFNGTSDYIELPSSVALNTDFSFSVEAWINKGDIILTGKYFDDAVFGQSDGAVGSDFPMVLLEIRNDKIIRGMIRGSSSPLIDLYTTKTLEINSWHHLVLVRNRLFNNLTIYLDGEMVKEGTGQLAGNTRTNDYVSIGGCFDDLQTVYRFFNGKIDMVRIWNKALTQTEIDALRTDNFELD